jgi:hypothetical protein
VVNVLHGRILIYDPYIVKGCTKLGYRRHRRRAICAPWYAARA